MVDHYIHIVKNVDQFSILGQPKFSAGHKIWRAGFEEVDGVYAEWTWDGRCLRVRNSWNGFYPIYYFVKPDEICVSPSIPRLLAQGAPTEFDEAAIAVFLRLGFFLGEDTPFRAIRAVPPDTAFDWKEGKLQVSGKLSFPKPQNLNRDDAIDAFISIFRDAVRRRAPIGDFAVPLSGGRDSRHILLELSKAGYRPNFCMTVQNYPPQNIEDAKIAAELTHALRIDHVLLDQNQSRVKAEIRKNLASGFCTDEHAWLLPMIDCLQDERVFTIYDGIGGDVLSAGLFLHARELMLYEAGKFEELGGYLLTKYSEESEETGLRSLLKSNYYLRFGREKAISRLLRELKKHENQPNPISSFFFWNRTRREIALSPFSIFSEVQNVYAPYLDHDVYNLLASLPASNFLDHTFHTAAIHRAFPHYKNIRFENKNESPIDAKSYYMRFARELAWYMLTSKSSRLVNKHFLVLRLIRCARDGQSRVMDWLHPVLALYLLQLEDFMEKLPLQDPCSLFRQNEFPEVTLAEIEELAAQVLLNLPDEPEKLSDGLEPLETRWFQRVNIARQEITALVPPGETLILVDEGQWGIGFVPGRQVLPFIESDGQYWGPPADDKIALQEFDRLRQAGASFIIFGWPAFWWLDEYLGLHRYLYSNFSCVLENERLVAFDLC